MTWSIGQSFFIYLITYRLGCFCTFCFHFVDIWSIKELSLYAWQIFKPLNYNQLWWLENEWNKTFRVMNDKHVSNFFSSFNHRNFVWSKMTNQKYFKYLRNIMTSWIFIFKKIARERNQLFKCSCKSNECCS